MTSPSYGFMFPDLEPWPESIDGAQLLDELAQTFREYVVLPKGAPEALALWCVHTYVFDCWDVSPILAVTSPVKRCGKTTLLTVLSVIANRCLAASSVSVASIFRTVEAVEPTLIIDEFDTANRNHEMRAIINSGHTRGTAFVLRNVRAKNDDWTPKRFPTWCPKAIGGIGSLPSTIHDRAIVICMKRKQREESVARMRASRLENELEELRRKIARWTADNAVAFAETDPDMIEGISDRAADNWTPLLAIATVAGGDWPKRAAEAARTLTAVSGGRDNDVSLDLLTDVKELFEERGNPPQLASKDVVRALVEREDRPWGEFNRGFPITPHGLAKLLREFDIKLDKFRNGLSTSRGYRLADFEEAWERYLR